MENKYFTNPELSEKLEELGVESQFNVGWNWYWIGKDGKRKRRKPKLNGLGNWTQQSYHFSDILLPENSDKIFEDGINSTYEFVKYAQGYCHCGSHPEWQQWLEEQVDKALNK